MPNYIRASVAGGTFFFTLALADRSDRLLTEHIALLRKAFCDERQTHPFRVDAIVILPDHLHCLWTLPPGDDDFSNRWRRIKAAFSSGLPEHEPRSASGITKGERGIWQRRFWEHCIRDEQDFSAHADYIHFNPVKHGLATRVADWPFSSFHRHVRQGLLPANWGGDAVVDLDAGE
jgi:putative transposase